MQTPSVLADMGFKGRVADSDLAIKVTRYWLRHPAARWLMESGADPGDAAGVFRMTVEMLLDDCGHRWPDHQCREAPAVGGSR